ncbi:MAG: DMT family transporter [Candidatus Hydrogenedentes bacterium]|nr:DMT family transporter [Candidatus Hydrogenedentota bacterium]
MIRLDKNVVMLWLMALALAIVILISRHLMAHGLHPLHLALIQALGSFLSILAVRRGTLPALPLLRESTRYFAWASLLGFTIPNLIVFAAVPHTGVGLATLAHTMPLVVAYIIALGLRVESFHLRKMVFLAVTVAGAALFAATRLGAGSGGVTPWHALLFLAPISIGIANIYRSVSWPSGLRPTEVALVTTLAATVTFSALALKLPVHTPLSFFLDAKHVTLLAFFMALAGLGQLLLFHLQDAAGPVFIGQTGALVALFGGVLGFVFFGETYTAVTLLGSLLIILGVYKYCQISAEPVKTR